MINVILYPTIFIGIFLIGWAVALYTLQFVQPQVTKESDIILSTITSLCGGILFFQGWRLDPLLFTCYILLVVTIILLSLELFQLRNLLHRQLDSTQPPARHPFEKYRFKEDIPKNETKPRSQSTKEKTGTKKYSAFLQNEFIKPQIDLCPPEDNATRSRTLASVLFDKTQSKTDNEK